MSDTEAQTTTQTDTGNTGPAVTTEINNGIAQLRFDNAPYHYMDEVLLPMLDATFDDLAARDDVRVIVLSNTQPGFFITHYSLSDIEKTPVSWDRCNA